MTPLIISVEGNIGVGKSTLLNTVQMFIDKLVLSQNMIIVKEPIEEWLKITDNYCSFGAFLGGAFLPHVN